MISERWPKSGVDVVITVLEGEESDVCHNSPLSEGRRTECWGMMSLLSGCITVASAAIIDAGIDCTDIVTGGVAAIVRQPSGPPKIFLDPCPSDDVEIFATCVIGYLQSKDEIIELWAKGSMMASKLSGGVNSVGLQPLIDEAVEAAIAARLVLIEAIKESTEVKIRSSRIGHQEDAAS